VELHEYDEIIRTLVRVAAHQDIINEKQDLANQRLTLALERIDTTLKVVKDLLGRGNGRCRASAHAERLGLGTLGRRFEDPEPTVAYVLVERLGENTVAVMQQKTVIMVSLADERLELRRCRKRTAVPSSVSSIPARDRT